MTPLPIAMRQCLKGLALGAALLLGGRQQATAQVDPHFSQYYVYPSWLNPALTGAFDGEYRVSGIYRNQWNNVSSAFQTPGLSADFTTSKNINFGVSVMNQTAGDGGYNYLTGYASAAYTGLRFGNGDYQRIVFGMQAGLINRRFNPNKLKFGDQWNPVTGQATQPTLDVFTKTSAATFDAGAGILYFDAQPGKKFNLFAGYSANHLTMPEDPFLASGQERLPMRHTVHGGARIAASQNVTITPNLMYLRQGNAQAFMAGAYVSMRANETTEFLAGANYRINDAFSPFVGFNYRNMVLGASYDINSSDLGKLAQGASAFEISLSFVGRRSARTPETEFVCPRL